MAHRFDSLADEFVSRVLAIDIQPTTEVVALLHCTDISGKPLDPIRIDMMPLTKVSIPSNPGFARDFAMQQHMDGITGTINSIVRSIPDGPYMMPNYCDIPIVVHDVGLEINQPEKSPDDQ